MLAARIRWMVQRSRADGLKTALRAVCLAPAPSYISRMPIVRVKRPKPQPRKSIKPSKPRPAVAIVTALLPRRWRYELAEYVPNEEADAKAWRFLDRMIRPPSMD